MKISVVIPNYNGERLLKENLSRVIESLGLYKDSEIIISDDASLDHSIEVARSIFKNSKTKYKILINNKNVGFSSNVNLGISKAKGDIIVLLNTDVVPSLNFLDPLILDFESDENLFGIGLMDKSVEGNNVVLRGRGIARWSRGFIVHSRGEVDRPDTFWISGGSSLLRRSLVEKLGAFDSLYDPFYWEDIDLSYRARKSGYKIKFNSKSFVEHKHEEGAIKKQFSTFQIKSIAYRNQFIFIWKNITDLNLIVSHLFWLPYHFTTAVIRTDYPFFTGFVGAILKLCKIIKKRNDQKKFYKKKDKELFS